MGDEKKKGFRYLVGGGDKPPATRRERLEQEKPEVQAAKATTKEEIANAKKTCDAILGRVDKGTRPKLVELAKNIKARFRKIGDEESPTLIIKQEFIPKLVSAGLKEDEAKEFIDALITLNTRRLLLEELNGDAKLRVARAVNDGYVDFKNEQVKAIEAELMKVYDSRIPTELKGILTERVETLIRQWTDGDLSSPDSAADGRTIEETLLPAFERMTDELIARYPTLERSALEQIGQLMVKLTKASVDKEVLLNEKEKGRPHLKGQDGRSNGQGR